MTLSPSLIHLSTACPCAAALRAAVVTLCAAALAFSSGCASARLDRQFLANAESMSMATRIAFNGSSPVADRRLPVEPDFDDLPAPPREAVTKSPPTVSAPQAFAWQNTGHSAGSRPFQIATAGQDGYRTLVIGSVGGNDPLAIGFVERLARHLHSNQQILGGFETTIVRTLNPDGEASKSVLNQKGVYINHQFPKGKTGSAVTASASPEVQFVLNRIRDFQPQRVIHIRTVPGKQGLIAAGSSASGVANELATWLSFGRTDLPGRAVEGSLERYLSQNGTAQIITIGLPDQVAATDSWNAYGDAVLNLLLGDDLATRDIARRQREQSSASKSK